MYRYILLRTNMEFLYCPVPSRTGTYWYVPVRTILPNPVQGYRIPDENVVLISLNRCGMVVVGLGASLKGENQIWSEKRILLYFQIIMS